MKLKENFILRQVAGSWIVMPLGVATVDFNGMLTLNETGALLWHELESDTDRETLADALMKEYIVEHSQALADVDEFLEKLRKIGCLEE